MITFDDKDMLVGQIVKKKTERVYQGGVLHSSMHISMITGQGHGYVVIDGTGVGYKRLLEEWIYLDNKPCGKEVTE